MQIPGEPTSGLEPLSCSLRVITHALQGLHRFANPAYLGGFLFSGLLRVAPYCAPGGIRLVSGRATRKVRQQVQWHALATFGATIHRHPFLSVAQHCRIGIDKLISMLTVAHGFCVLRVAL